MPMHCSNLHTYVVLFINDIQLSQCNTMYSWYESLMSLVALCYTDEVLLCLYIITDVDSATYDVNAVFAQKLLPLQNTDSGLFKSV